MEALGNNRKAIGIKNFSGPHHGIKCTEPGKIEHNFTGRDPGIHQILAHRTRLIVAVLGIIAAQQQILHFAAVICINRALNTIPVILVNCPVFIVLSRTEYHADFARRQVIDIFIDIRRGFPANPAICRNSRCCRQNNTCQHPQNDPFPYPRFSHYS